MSRQISALTLMLLVSTTVVSAAAPPGPTNFPDPPSPKDGQLSEFQLLTETECTNGHFAGLSAPTISVIPPSERPASDHGAPGYRIFISCPEGYLRTAIWNPANNKLSSSSATP